MTALRESKYRKKHVSFARRRQGETMDLTEEDRWEVESLLRYIIIVFENNVLLFLSNLQLETFELVENAFERKYSRSTSTKTRYSLRG